MMNKLCRSLVKVPLFEIQKPFVRANIFSFASSKPQQQSKPTQSKNPQPQNSSLLKTTTTLQTKDPKSKKTAPQRPNQPKGALTQQQKKELALQQKLQAIYTELDSFPTDSYETVMQNYKRIKAKLNNRKVYVPNKPQLLAQFDNNLQLIKKHHKVWRAPSTSPQRNFSDTKQEIIQWELEQAKKKYYLSLLENQKFLIGVAAGIVVIIAWLQYYNFVRVPLNEQQKAPKMFL